MMMAMGTIVVLSGSRLGYDNRSTIRVRVGVSQDMLHGHQYVATVSTICNDHGQYVVIVTVIGQGRAVSTSHVKNVNCVELQL